VVITWPDLSVVLLLLAYGQVKKLKERSMAQGNTPYPTELIEEICDDDGVLRLTLNDPATRNSLSEAMLIALAGKLAAARDNQRLG